MTTYGAGTYGSGTYGNPLAFEIPPEPEPEPEVVPGDRRGCPAGSPSDRRACS